MNRTMTTLLAAGALCALPVLGDADAARLLFAAEAGALRDFCAASATNIGHFAKLVGGGRADWESVRQTFGEERLRDFFAGANIHMGPSGADGCILSLYNPWWDAILLLELSGEPQPGKGPDSQAKIRRLRMAGGEIFRGEDVGGKPQVRTVMPDKDPLSVEIWRVEARTLARFRERCPLEGRVRFPRDLGTGAAELGWEAVQARSALRLKLLGAFAKLDDYGRKPGASKLVLAAARMREALRYSGPGMLKRLFADPAHAFFCDTFAGLPDHVRQGFVLYGYVPSKEGTLFIFLNPSMPRVYATVSFPKNRENERKGPPVILEWYDLAKAGELLKAARPGEAVAPDALSDGDVR